MHDTTDDGSHASTGPRAPARRSSASAGRATRRDVLAGLGAGALSIGLGTASSPASAMHTEEPTERRYRECHHFTIPVGTLPEDVQAEVDAALADGEYVSESPPLLEQASDVDASYLSDDGEYYEATVEHQDHSYVLTLDAVEERTLEEPRTLSIRNGDSSTHELEVILGGPDDEELLTERFTVDAGERVEVYETRVAGNYTVWIPRGTVHHSDQFDSDPTEDDTYTWSVDQYGTEASIDIAPGGEVNLSQAVPDPVPCEYELDPEPALDVRLDDVYGHPGDTVEGEIVLSAAPTGLSEFEVGLGLDTAEELLEIEVDVAEPFEETSLRSVADPYPVEVAGIDADDAVAPGDTDVTLATFAVHLPEEDASGTPIVPDVSAPYPEDYETPSWTLEAHATHVTDQDGYHLAPAERETTVRVDPVHSPPFIDGCPDVNENGEIDYLDVVEFFENQHREEWKQPDIWDFTGNGSVGHGDVIWVFECVALD